MIRLRVKNFGPIHDGMKENDGWLEFKRVTAFVGNQGSGKSTLAKLFSTFSWIEKALVRGDYEKKWFERRGRLQNQFFSYHRLENYIEPDGLSAAEIEYEGEAYCFRFSRGQLTITQREENNYRLPQVMYVPSERNFISYIRHPREIKLSSESLKEFLTEFDNAKSNMKGSIQLPINNAELEYDKLNDILNIKDSRYKLRLTDASSGFQSFVPLFLVSQYLAETVNKERDSAQPPMTTDELERFKQGVEGIFSNSALTEEQKRVALSVLSSRFNKTAFINIVEEPEQNLFPTSQWEILKGLLALNNQGKHNRLVLTTHSPYIANYLSIAVLGQQLRGRIEKSPKREVLLARLGEIIPLDSLVSFEDIAIYQTDQKLGVVNELPSINKIPSDKNYLNDALRTGNNLFDKLLELEEELLE